MHDTCRIHTYIRGYVSRALALTCGLDVPRVPRGWIWDTCISSCISDVFGCIPHVSWLPLQILVSCMYPACILHLRYVPLRIHLRYMYPNLYLGSIPHVSLMYPRTTADTFIPHVSLINLAFMMNVSCMCILEPLQIHVSRMDPACIPHVFRMYPSWSCISRAFLLVGVPTLPELQRRAKTMKRARTAAVHLDQLIDLKHLAFKYYWCQHHDASKIHVSWFCISVYLDVSWWRVQDTCILMYPDMYPVRTSRKRIRYMYLDVSDVYPKCILDSYALWDTCKILIHAKMSRYMYPVTHVSSILESWNVTEHVRYIWDTSGYTQDTCILQDTCRIHHDTSGYVSDRTPPPKG